MTTTKHKIIDHPQHGPLAVLWGPGSPRSIPDRWFLQIAEGDFVDSFWGTEREVQTRELNRVVPCPNGYVTGFSGDSDAGPLMGESGFGEEGYEGEYFTTEAVSVLAVTDDGVAPERWNLYRDNIRGLYRSILFGDLDEGPDEGL